MKEQINSNNEIDNMSIESLRQEITMMDPKNGAIVHEFRNMLMGIRAGLKLIEMDYEKKGVNSKNVTFTQIKKDLPERYKYITETYSEMKDLIKRGYKI